MPNTRPFRVLALAVLVAFSAVSSGCYRYTAIRPDQLMLLSGVPNPTAPGGVESPIIDTARPRTLLSPEGTTVEVAGKYDLVLTLANDREYWFEYPVRTMPSGSGVLEVTGSNLPATRFNLAEVREASVARVNRMLPFFILAVGLLIVLPAAAAVYVFGTRD